MIAHRLFKLRTQRKQSLYKTTIVYNILCHAAAQEIHSIENLIEDVQHCFDRITLLSMIIRVSLCAIVLTGGHGHRRAAIPSHLRPSGSFGKVGKLIGMACRRQR